MAGKKTCIFTITELRRDLPQNMGIQSSLTSRKSTFIKQNYHQFSVFFWAIFRACGTNRLLGPSLSAVYHLFWVFYRKGTNFREYKFSRELTREFVFAIEIFENFVGTYFREFREFKIFRIYLSRISRFSYFFFLHFARTI